jgi:hypothetical protein
MVRESKLTSAGLILFRQPYWFFLCQAYHDWLTVVLFVISYMSEALDTCLLHQSQHQLQKHSTIFPLRPRRVLPFTFCFANLIGLVTGSSIDRPL